MLQIRLETFVIVLRGEEGGDTEGRGAYTGWREASLILLNVRDESTNYNSCESIYDTFAPFIAPCNLVYFHSISILICAYILSVITQ